MAELINLGISKFCKPVFLKYNPVGKIAKKNSLRECFFGDFAYWEILKKISFFLVNTQATD